MKETKMNQHKQWWESPEGEEYHTARVWEQIAVAASAAGDERRAEEARLAAEFESRQAGAC